MRVGIFMLVAFATIQGCQKHASEMGEAQSLDFYNKNAEIAKTVAEKCAAYENKELSKLSGAQQREWQDSTDGVNCENAKKARSFQIIAERRQELRKSNEALRRGT